MLQAILSVSKPTTGLSNSRFRRATPSRSFRHRKKPVPSVVRLSRELARENEAAPYAPPALIQTRIAARQTSDGRTRSRRWLSLVPRYLDTQLPYQVGKVGTRYLHTAPYLLMGTRDPRLQDGRIRSFVCRHAPFRPISFSLACHSQLNQGCVSTQPQTMGSGRDSLPTSSCVLVGRWFTHLPQPPTHVPRCLPVDRYLGMELEP